MLFCCQPGGAGSHLAQLFYLGSMNTRIRRYLLVLTPGLLAQPAYALGDQITGWIYGALGVAGVVAVVVLVLVVKFFIALFSPRVEPTGKLGQVTIPSGKEALFFLALGLGLLLAYGVGW